MQKSLMVLRKFNTCPYLTRSSAHLRDFIERIVMDDETTLYPPVIAYAMSP